MRALVDRIAWLAVPLAAYLVVTLLLPALHGATRRAGYLHHAGLVALGCIAVLAIAVTGVALARKGGRP